MVRLAARTWGAILRAALVTLFVPALLTAADNNACKLLTATELEPVVGGKLSAFKGESYSSADVCTATSDNAKVLLRWFRGKKDSSPDAAAKGLEIAKKMGATVDVKTFGPIVCSTIIPPKGQEFSGFSTTCSVSKAANVAAVAITVKARRDMVSIDKLHPLAEKMAGRF